jgi:RNA polymerase sigma factor (TIGR02999 family)
MSVVSGALNLSQRPSSLRPPPKGLELMAYLRKAAPVTMSDVTRILDAIQQGEPKAAEQLLPLVYQELRRVAAARMANGPPGHTLQPTALVHEAWLRLVGNQNEAQFRGRTHFFAAAAEAMRHILIDRARRKQAARHGGGLQRVDSDDLEIATPADDDELLAVNDALERLAAADPAKAELVKLRYFVGMTIEEAAAALGISEPTAKRRWSLARAWLFNEIRARRQ